VRTPLAESSNRPCRIVHGLSKKSTTGELFQTVGRQWRLELSSCSYWLQVVTVSAEESNSKSICDVVAKQLFCQLCGAYNNSPSSTSKSSKSDILRLFLSTIGHGGECTALVRELSHVFTTVHLLHAVHSPPCPNLYIKGRAASLLVGH